MIYLSPIFYIAYRLGIFYYLPICCFSSRLAHRRYCTLQPHKLKLSVAGTLVASYICFIRLLSLAFHIHLWFIRSNGILIRNNNGAPQVSRILLILHYTDEGMG